MRNFVGRIDELSRLEEMYKSDAFQFAVMYGRRRVGKTTLINEFCRDKKTVFCVGIESSEKENLRSFSDTLWKAAGQPDEMPPFESFRSFFHYVVDWGK